ncbi:hypothetical protein V2V72_07665 [Streptococcus agalactiae]
MIISLDEAKKIDPAVTEEALIGLETMVRNITNNNFQSRNFRVSGLELSGSTIKAASGRMDIFRPEETIEINDSQYNNGLYTILNVSDAGIEVSDTFIPETNSNAIATKVDYPADVVEGIKKLISYDLKMAGKIGVKSESISRWSVTYYDVTSTESVEGYPATLLGFLKKYKKLRWS